MSCLRICFVWMFLHDWVQVKHFWQEYCIGDLCTTHFITPGSIECSFVLVLWCCFLITWLRWCYQLSALWRTLSLSKLINNLWIPCSLITFHSLHWWILAWVSYYSVAFLILAFLPCLLAGILLETRASLLFLRITVDSCILLNTFTIMHYHHYSFWCSNCPRLGEQAPLHFRSYVLLMYSH